MTLYLKNKKEFDELLNNVKKKVKEDKLPPFYADVFPRIIENLDQRLTTLENQINELIKTTEKRTEREK